MDNKMRARNYYAAAVSLFQKSSVDDCKRAIELLDEAVVLYPDFSEASIFRQEVWHCLLKSLDPDDNCGTYKEYLDSPAWKMKRDDVIKRDGGQCVCSAQATVVHHKTYCNIGKEPLSDLVALCEECHEREHKPYVPTNRQPPPELGQAYWDKFKLYVEENGNRLQLFPEPNLPSFYGIQIDQKIRNAGDAVWLIAFRNAGELQANLCMESPTHYEQLKEQKNSIEEQFEDNLGELKWQDQKKRVGFFDNTVEHVSSANIGQEFPWLHNRLIRLHEVLQPIISEL